MARFVLSLSLLNLIILQSVSSSKSPAQTECIYEVEDTKCIMPGCECHEGDLLRCCVVSKCLENKSNVFNNIKKFHCVAESQNKTSSNN